MFGWLKTYHETGKELCDTGVCYTNLRTVVGGKIYRSAAPEKYEDLERMTNGLRLKTVIDLRLEENRTDGFYDPREQDWCYKLGIKHVSIPMHDKAPILESEFDNALGWLDLPDMAPFLIHCESGRHRTGAVVAAWRVLRQGWFKKDAWAEAVACGYYDAMGHKPVRLSWETYVTTKLLDGAAR